MACFEGNWYPRVIFAEPVSQPPSVRHSASSSGPAARWIAPSTPTPPSSERFAAFTMASTWRVVMSATRMSQVAEPMEKVKSGLDIQLLRGPAAVDRVGRARDALGRIAREKYCEGADVFRRREFQHRLLLGEQLVAGLLDGFAR